MRHLKMMIKKISIVLFVSLFFAMPVFAEVDQRISNNEFYIESLRLSKLAQETYEYGDYDASAGFAQEAILYAQLSDEYVSTQLVAEAARLLAWADANNVAARFPNNYNEGKEQYEIAVIAHSDEEWNDSIVAAINAIEIFGAFESTGRPGTTTAVSRPATGTTGSTGTTTSGNNRQYTVRTWRVEKDCLWNIAGYSWVYGDPHRWVDLYEANRSRMPEPDNPDLIHPGMVLDIPR